MGAFIQGYTIGLAYVMPTLVSLLKSKINDTVFRWINIICGLIIMVYGVKLFINFINLLKVMF